MNGRLCIDCGQDHQNGLEAQNCDIEKIKKELYFAEVEPGLTFTVEQMTFMVAKCAQQAEEIENLRGSVATYRLAIQTNDKAALIAQQAERMKELQRALIKIRDVYCKEPQFDGIKYEVDRLGSFLEEAALSDSGGKG